MATGKGLVAVVVVGGDVDAGGILDNAGAGEANVGRTDGKLIEGATKEGLSKLSAHFPKAIASSPVASPVHRNHPPGTYSR